MTIFEWKDEIAVHETYQRELMRIEHMYKKNNQFRNEDHKGTEEKVRTVCDSGSKAIF